MRNFILFLVFSAAAFGQCGSAGKLIKNPITGLFDCTAVAGAGLGSVTSVGLVGTANQITVTGASPITDSGSWTVSIPTNPTLPGNTTGTFIGNLTGSASKLGSGSYIPILSSGTPSASVAADIVSLFSTCSGVQYLGADGACHNGGGAGDVVGPSSATDNAVARFDSTTGKLIQNSLFIVDDSGNVTTPGSVSSGSGSGVGGAFDMLQGTLPAIVANTISHVAPTSVTGYEVVEPGAAGTGFLLYTNSSNVVTETIVGSSGSGSVCLTTSCVMTTPNIGTPSAGVMTNMTGLALAGTPLTTKGDLLGVSTVLGRLGIGSDGLVLTADAASTFGFKWAAAGGSSAFSALTGSTNTTAAMAVGTGASLDVSGSGTINATSLGGSAAALYAKLASPTFTGTVVFPSGQVLIAPVLGTPTSGTLTNATGLPAAGVVGTAAILGANTFTGQQIISLNGAASTPPWTMTGTWATGTATTAKAQALIECTGATSTGWSTAGTGMGVNACSGFTGNLIDVQLNGSSKMKVDSTGLMTVADFRSLGSLNLALSSNVQWASSSRLYSTSDGNNWFTNNATTGYTILKFGTQTATGPALSVTVQTNPILKVTDATGGATANLWIPAQASATGQRYVCIDTNGQLVSSAAACVGT